MDKQMNMTTRLVGLLIGLVALVGLSACETMKGLWDSRAKIEEMLAVAAAGHYTIVATKDGVPMYESAWDCKAGPDGKLAGCHKVAESPPPVELEPLKTAPRTLKAPK